MRKVQCEECGKRYDFDIDDFCPKCGAFNPPGKGTGTVVRADGINESNHRGSFVHRELHQEDRTRRRVGLEQQVRPPLGTAGQEAHRQKEQTHRKGRISLIAWIIIGIAAVNLFSRLIGYLLFWW